MRLIDADACREDFMQEVYAELESDPDNVRANRIIDLFDMMPTIESPRDWTPCAEELPTKTADYKVTVQVGSEMGTWRETKIIPYRIVDGVGSWILPKSDWLIYGVIAWTKADEPWEGGLDGK